jgi:hypothetical protein
MISNLAITSVGFIFLLGKGNFHRLVGKFGRHEGLFWFWIVDIASEAKYLYCPHRNRNENYTHSVPSQSSVHASHDIPTIKGRDWPPHPSLQPSHDLLPFVC